jgi:alkylation response protein AidB-like acyl-CoA dehydrogenase
VPTTRYLAAVLSTIEAVGRQADARASETERLRRLPDELAAALVGAGVFRLCVPRRYGGGEAHLLEVLEVIERLAYHDGSTGWCAMIGATTGLTAALLPPEFAQEIYGDPGSVTGGYALPVGTAVPVEGGLLVNGRWAWGSGANHCTWIGGGCWVVDGSGERVPRPDGLIAPFVFFPRSQVELLDTWRVAGLGEPGARTSRSATPWSPRGGGCSCGGRGLWSTGPCTASRS